MGYGGLFLAAPVMLKCRSTPDRSIEANREHPVAGGALLDMGLYALTWVFQILYHCQPDSGKETPAALSAIHKYHTGVDESASIILQFPRNKSTGIALSSFRIDSVSDNGQSSDACVRIQGPLGEIQVAAPAHRPSRFKIVKEVKDAEVFEFPVPCDPESKIGHGMFWEADEAARCVRDGRLESEGLPLQEVSLSTSLPFVGTTGKPPSRHHSSVELTVCR